MYCIDLSCGAVVFTRYRMTNMSGQLSQCSNWHQAGKPDFDFWIPGCLYGTEMHNSPFSLNFYFY